MVNEKFFSEKNIKTLSVIGTRAAFGQVCNEIIKNEEKLMIVTADVSTSQDLINLEKLPR